VWAGCGRLPRRIPGERKSGAFADDRERRHNMRASVTDDLGSIHDSGKLLTHWRGFTVLPAERRQVFGAL
jgi:hypothetical protein